MFIQELNTAENLQFLTKTRYGRIACTNENQPYIVPFHFAFDGNDYIYAFSTVGQKIEWMRLNRLVCVEVDDIKNQFEWTSLVIFGSYEELPDTTEFALDREIAHQYLSLQPMWWEPGYVARTHHGTKKEDYQPIYFRILIDKITGHRAIPSKV